jgi:hypothetical protein
MNKRFIMPLCAVALVLTLGFSAFADTIRLKDGSVIRGEVVGFKDQQFTVLVGSGSRGRRSTVTLYMEDVESIEFDSTNSSAASSPSTNDDDNVMSGVSTPQSSAPVPRPSPTRPSSTQPPPTTRPTNTTGANTSRPSTTTTTNNNRPATSQPTSIQVNARVRADNTSNGWTNSGLVVRRGQRLRVTAMGQISLGNGKFSTPAGVSTVPGGDKLMRDEATGALIAVIGDDNNDFIFIGRTREFIAQRDGVLFLGVNEENLADNTGAYDAVIEAEVR